MLFDNGTARIPGSRKPRAHRPTMQILENRVCLSLDLANIADNPATPAFDPLGVQNAGLDSQGGAGFSVAEVGDVNGDGFDDYLIGEPTINTTTPPFNLGNGAGSKAFLVFGSRQVNSVANIDFRTLNAQQRIGDLGTLGNGLQNNPTNGAPGFAYDGLTFITGQNSNAQLGASVTALGDINGDGFADFMIGAPGANDINGANPGTGRAYLVYGGPNLVRTNKTVDFDNPSANSDLNIITFVNRNQPNANTGRAVGPAGDVITDGLPDIAIGAPNASINGVASGGAVYLLSGTFLRPARTETVDLSTVGQTNGVAGILFAGAITGENAGASVSTAGNFNNDRTSALQSIDDLLIGAPATTSGNPGAAFLVYGAIGLQNLATTSNGVNFISLGRVGVGDVPGVIFNGTNNGDETGFAVSTAGDFNGDGVSDILIGSPGFQTNRGRATLIFGRNATPNPPGSITGAFDIGALPNTIPNVEFRGQATGAVAGFSVTATGRINNDTLNEIAIGAPGEASGAGAAYLIPGNADLQGIVVLSQPTIEIPTIAGLRIFASSPTTPNFVGTSVSGNLFTNRSNQTVDADAIGDLVVGAAGLALNSSRINAGSAFVLEGTFTGLQVPVSTALTSDIGVGAVNPPFTINATTPADLTIFVLSRNRNNPAFQPFVDIDPTTIQVNGVPLPDPTTWTDVGDVDGDGVDDASFTFSPRSLLGLTAGTTTITVTARTLATSPLPGRRYSSSAQVTVTGGGGGGGGGLAGGTQNNFFGFGGFQAFVPPFGERLIPDYQTLARLSYKPIPTSVAFNQFFPQGHFRQRFLNFFHPPKHPHPLGSRHSDSQGRTSTLGRDVFTRGKFKAGQSIKPIHHGKRGGFHSVPPSLI